MLLGTSYLCISSLLVSLVYGKNLPYIMNRLQDLEQEDCFQAVRYGLKMSRDALLEQYKYDEDAVNIISSYKCDFSGDYKNGVSCNPTAHTATCYSSVDSSVKSKYKIVTSTSIYPYRCMCNGSNLCDKVYYEKDLDFECGTKGDVFA